MVTTNGLSVIGFFTWWSLKDSKISKDDFRSLLVQFGLDKYVPIPKEDAAMRRSAFLKAVREVKNSHRNEFLIRKILKSADMYKFGLVDEKVDKVQSHLNYSHNGTLFFNCETGSLTCDVTHRAFDEIKAKYDEYQNTLNADDIRSAILNIIKHFHTVGVRDRGGIYFLPAQFESEVTALEMMIEKLPGDNLFSIAPQIDASTSKKAIYRAFIADLKDKIANFKQEIDNESLSRKSAWEGRIAEYKELRKEIEFYKEALSFQAEDLDTDLTSLSNTVREKFLS
jgi:hypothetical protein